MIGLEEPPPVSENSPVKTPRLPRFFLICIHSVSSPSASCLLTSPPRLPPPLPPVPPSLPHYPPTPFFLSFCVSHHPALLHLHRGAALAIRTLHTYAHARADSLTHTHTRHTRTGRHTPTTSGSPPPSLLHSHTSPLQTRNILQPLVC